MVSGGDEVRPSALEVLGALSVPEVDRVIGIVVVAVDVNVDFIIVDIVVAGLVSNVDVDGLEVVVDVVITGLVCFVNSGVVVEDGVVTGRVSVVGLLVSVVDLLVTDVDVVDRKVVDDVDLTIGIVAAVVLVDAVLVLDNAVEVRDEQYWLSSSCAAWSLRADLPVKPGTSVQSTVAADKFKKLRSASSKSQATLQQSSTVRLLRLISGTVAKSENISFVLEVLTESFNLTK